MCKEQLEVIQDDEDEAWYFVAAKQIKISTSNTNPNRVDTSSTGVAKKTVTVHAECLKQIEMSREN